MSKETIAAAILVEAYWNAAYQQGLEHREVDDEKGTAQAAETALAEYIAKLQTEAKHWRDQHANEVKRAKILKDTTDLPLERVRAYELMGELQGQVAALTQEVGYRDELSRHNIARAEAAEAVCDQLRAEVRRLKGAAVACPECESTFYEKGAESMRERAAEVAEAIKFTVAKDATDKLHNYTCGKVAGAIRALPLEENEG